MAQGFVIALAATGAALALLQAKRSELAAAAANKTDGAGATVKQESTTTPSTSPAFGNMPGISSGDGITGGSTSCTPTATKTLAAVGTTEVDIAGTEVDAMSLSAPPVINGSTSETPSEGTMSAPAPLPAPMPTTTYRDYLLATTYGTGQTVTAREESDNLSAIGPSVGAIW